MTDHPTAPYNYPAFVPENFEPLMRFDESPQIGEVAPDFALRNLDGTGTSLSALWSAQAWLVVEFGSFT
jgi:hypothetical protein